MRGCANPRMHTGISVHPIPVCIRGFAHPRMHTGIGLDPRMHTGITSHAIPVCIRGFLCDSCMHTGICLIPVCIRGFLLIPICIRGLDVNQSPYAYGDFHSIQFSKGRLVRCHFSEGSDIPERKWGVSKSLNANRE